jgi:hypothetical protein
MVQGCGGIAGATGCGRRERTHHESRLGRRDAFQWWPGRRPLVRSHAQVGNLERMKCLTGKRPQVALLKAEPRAARPIDPAPGSDQPLWGQCCVSNEAHNGWRPNDPQPCWPVRPSWTKAAFIVRRDVIVAHQVVAKSGRWRVTGGPEYLHFQL